MCGPAAEEVLSGFGASVCPQVMTCADSDDTIFAVFRTRLAHFVVGEAVLGVGAKVT